MITFTLSEVSVSAVMTEVVDAPTITDTQDTFALIEINTGAPLQSLTEVE